MSDKTLIQYLSTDLDLVCDIDPTALAAKLRRCGLFVNVTHGADGLWYVLCEDDNDIEPEPNIVRLLDAVDSLTGDAKAIWQRCSKREFNIGYDCGDEPWAFNQSLSNDALQRMASCGATLRVTMYPVRKEGKEPMNL